MTPTIPAPSMDSFVPIALLGLSLICLLAAVIVALTWMAQSHRGESAETKNNPLKEDLSAVLETCRSLSQAIKTQKDNLSQIEHEVHALKDEDVALRDDLKKDLSKYLNDFSTLKDLISKLEDKVKGVTVVAAPPQAVTTPVAPATPTQAPAAPVAPAASVPPASPAPEEPTPPAAKEAKPGGAPSPMDILAMLKSKK